MKHNRYFNFTKNTIMLLVLLSCLFSLTYCSKFDDPAVYIPPATDTVQYAENIEDFPNPERGFYRVAEAHTNHYELLNVDQMKTWRTLQQADGGNYKLYSSLVFRQLVLEDYTDKDLTQGLLYNVAKDFTAARTAGMKLVLRFSYTVTANAGSCPEGFICPPYGDAPKAVVLKHIAQLKPLLQENADVIACLQMGFIGTWGENYFSDYFGDPSNNGNGKMFDENWTDKTDVLKALLEALPADRMIQVRTPQMKQRAVYGVNASTSSAALTDAEAFTGTMKARIGMHNDCFLASADDYGTYADYGNSSLPRADANAILRAYAEEDNKYVVVGGETCDDTFSPQNDCENAGFAQTEMRKLHYSFLNCAYNNDVNNDWETGGCMDNIRKQLGYRFVLHNGVYPATATKAGKQFAFTLNLENAGYASPYNERQVKLILRSQDGAKMYTYDIATDIRKWYSGAVKLEVKIITEAAMAKGKYDLLLYMPDKYSSIAARSEYAIRLANDNVWEEATGYNKLNATVTVE
jgi:Domain of unknown function (DUF4832)/Domain of unknown function (DUF4874)